MSANSETAQSHVRAFWIGISRAFAGATIFALPMLMTMEMWQLGFHMTSWQLAQLILVNILLLTGLERYWGFKRNVSWFDSIVDTFVGYAIGFVVATLFLPLFGVLNSDMSVDEIIGKISLQAVPASIGALLARSQLGHVNQQQRDRTEIGRYLYELFLMITGAIFISFNVAPTEEMILIAYQITEWQSLLLIIFSLIIIHAFVYKVGFGGQERWPEHNGFWRVFFRYAITGYAVVLLVSLYMLWTFGRLEDNSMQMMMYATIVLAMPGSVGAAAARLII